MDKLFYAKWVRNGSLIGKVKIVQPVVDEDKENFYGGSNYEEDWPSASTGFKNASSGQYPHGIPYTLTVTECNYMVGMQSFESMVRDYYENPFIMDQFQNGDRLILSNGSYILFLSAIYQESSYWKINVEYHIKDDTIAYSNIIIDCYVTNDGITLSSIPWRLYHTPNNQIQEIECSYYAGVGCRYVVGSTWDPVNATLGGRFWDGIEPDDPDDPYPDDDDSDDDDGGDSVVPDDDPIDIPDVPDVSVSDSGFLTLYNPTMSQVQNLASFMWSGLFDPATFKKLFADPMECIIGLNLLPVAVPNTEPYEVKIGNISTGVYMPKVSAQFVKVSCGTVNLAPIHDSYMDFAPYSKWSIYLPYIGIQSLSADDVAHKSLTVEYIVDVLTCACIAFIKAGTHVLYQFAGTCGYDIPLTSENFSRVIGNLAQLCVTVGGAVATGGASAPLNVGAVASTMNNLTANKPDVHRSGALGGSAGIMGRQKPYLIIEYPHLCKPTNQPKYLGYPSFTTRRVGAVPGYTEWETLVLDGIPCTEAEREEILEVMKGGCYV